MIPSEEIDEGELTQVNKIVESVILQSQDDRLKADQLMDYFQQLITSGDTKGETRQALTKALELRETPVTNLTKLIELKVRLMEKKIMAASRRREEEDYGRRKGIDSNDLISQMEE